MDKKRAQVIMSITIALLSFICLIIHFSMLILLLFVLSCIQVFLFYEKENIIETPEVEEKEEETTIDSKEKSSTSSELDFPPDFDEKEFAKLIFLLYRDIQTNFMDFEYDKLKGQLGIEMYEQFSKQMRHLEDSGRQSVRKNIELKKIQIMSFQQGKESDTAIVQLSVLEDKYMKKKEEAFRLTSARVRYESCYNLTFMNHHKKKIVRKCAYCNEKLKGNPSICPSCNHLLLESVDTWLLKDLQLVCSHSYSPQKKEC